MNPPAAALSRRGLLTATAAAAGAVVATVHLSRPTDPAPSGTSPAATGAAGSGGYRLTDHIQRYYQTTRV